MAEDKKPVFSIDYRLTLEDFLEYNNTVYKQSIKKQEKKLRLTGIGEIVVAVLFLASMLYSGQTANILYWILDISLLCMGVFSLLYYQKIFPKQMEKANRKSYEKSAYLKNTIELEFYDDVIKENTKDFESTVNWLDTYSLADNEKHYLIMLESSRGIVLPKNILNEEQIKFLSAFFLEKNIQKEEEKLAKA